MPDKHLRAIDKQTPRQCSICGRVRTVEHCNENEWTPKEMAAGCIDLEGGIYLPFASNGINCVGSQGKEVTSDNFTGCIMATYITRAGSRCVCHVSTGQVGSRGAVDKMMIVISCDPVTQFL